MRIAVIDRNACNPDKCQHECVRFCPGVRMGEKTIFLSNNEPIINEVLCTGCGICVKKCPFEAIKIINLPEQLSSDLIHEYGPNGFRLFRLPLVKFGKITGIVGKNGIGKTTAINILSGKLIPNLGGKKSSRDDVIEYFRGTQMHRYFKALYNEELKVALKPQPIYLIPNLVRGKVKSILEKLDEKGKMDFVAQELNLTESLGKRMKELSGGELQRLAIAIAYLKQADVYYFDEPSSYNDVYERLTVVRFIRKILGETKAIMVVDHDLAFLDYLSDEVAVVYGEAGAYGIFTRSESVRTGINIFLDGYVPSENVRFREKEIKFERRAPPKATVQEEAIAVEYTELIKNWNGFKLKSEPGKIYRGEVVGVLGPNAIGKTTFIRMLAGEVEVDEGGFPVQTIGLSYKPQYLSNDFKGTVKDFLIEKSGKSSLSNFNLKSLLIPLNLHKLLEREVKALSGGELQKLYIASCLSKEAEIYLLDEPSAFIDIEDRLTIISAITRYVKMFGKTGVVVDHDLLFVDSVSDRVIIFDGAPGVKGYAYAPMDKRTGFNKFLKNVGITIRRDSHTGRPRINKEGSRLDRVQRELGEYFYEPREA